MDEKALINLAVRLLLREAEGDDAAVTPPRGAAPDPQMARGANQEIDPKVQVFLDRVLLRFFCSPAVVVYLRDAKAHANGTIELVFSELPERVIPRIAELVGVPDGEVFAFNNPQTQYPCTGYRFKPRDEDLGGIKL